MKSIFSLVVLLLLQLTITAQTEIRKAHLNLSKKGIAASGYDPVAYFTQNKAVLGDSKFAVFAEGATYYFSSQENKALFLKNWKAYEPQYGGWCAYAMGDYADKVEINPETFKILNGKLYLFYNKRSTNTLTKWNKNEATLKADGDNNWAKIFK